MKLIFKRVQELYINLIKRKKLLRLSASLTLLVLTLLVTTITVSLKGIRLDSSQPVALEQYSPNLNTSQTNQFYNKDLEGKVTTFRESTQKDFKEDSNPNYKVYKAPERSMITFDVDTIHDFDENTSTLVAGGTIEANWKDEGIQESGETRDSDFYERTRKDLLSTSLINFYDAENQLYEKIDGGTKQGYKYSIYRFKGRFRLYRDLRKFPFDEALFRISLTNPIIPAADIRLVSHPFSRISAQNFRLNSYRYQKKLCSTNSTTKEWECSFNELRPRYTVKEDLLKKTGESDAFIKSYKELDYAPISLIRGTFQRSGPSGFFRYIVPLIFGVIALALTDQLTTNHLEVRVATPATILLTFIFMQSGYQSEIPQLSYITYMDKLYFLAYLLAILDLADAIVFVSPKNRIDKLCKKYLSLDFSKLIRAIFGLLAIAGPYVLFWTS